MKGGRPWKKRSRTGKAPRRSSFQVMRSRVRRGRGVGNFALSNLRTGGLMGIETKFWDTGIAVTNISNVANMTGAEIDPAAQLCLNAVAQGDSASQRDGNKITMKGISIRGTVNFEGMTDSGPGKAGDVFIALVLDTQTNGAQLNSEDVFSNPGALQDLVTSPFRNMDQVTRFRILKEKRIPGATGVITYNTTTSEVQTQGMARHWEMYVNLRDLLVNFKQTTSVIAALADNSLHLIATTTSELPTPPTITYNSRLRFVG